MTAPATPATSAAGPRSARAVLLAPGSGSSSGHHTLLALEAGLAPRPCVRIDFPYRLAGRPFPDRPAVLVASVVEAVADLSRRHGVEPGEVLLGGRSMGGRICSMAVAEGLPAAGLVLVGYPLHPPRKPQQLRTAHLPDVRVPCLFVSGTRDAFATPDELTSATATIPGPVTHHWVEGGRHELDRHDDEIVAVVRRWVNGEPARPPG